jgi:Fe-Mn family superoxide dismutase
MQDLIFTAIISPMNKRSFLKSGLSIAGLSLVNPAKSLQKLAAVSPFELPKLPYSYDALEPALDARTMEIHHSRHHAAYVEKLNAELSSGKITYQGIEDLLRNYAHQNKVIRNNGGGHFNHSLLWKTLTKPGSVKMPEDLAMDIIVYFGDMEDFMLSLKQTALERFGSGWAWLCKADDGRLFITSTPNQDNPLMKIDGLVQGKPLLGIDVWEHAYYLKFQNKRADYLDAFISCINWNEVNRLRLEK